MKEIRVAHILLTFVSLLMIGTALLVEHLRSDCLARTQDQQADFTFIFPDGETLHTKDIDEGRVVLIPDFGD